jgi:O-acetyl-ADP-ribose deacetylase (regulator of RNase III)
MKFIFNDRNRAICDVFSHALQGTLPNLEVRHCNFEAISKDDYKILFTPGNSYGQMTGGFDLAVRNVWPAAEAYVQMAISESRNGMLAVGDYVMVGLHAAMSLIPQKRLIYTPTMRIPMVIAGTENVYWAYRAAFQALEGAARGMIFTDEDAVLIPAFGTSAGHMDPLKAAMQCRLAYEHVHRPPVEVTSQQMFADHQAIAQWI